jgi:hypothetical protein
MLQRQEAQTWQNQQKTKFASVRTICGSKLESPKGERTSSGISQNGTCKKSRNIPRHLFYPVKPSAMDKNCPICFGLGGVCENHPDRAWDEELGCQCGAGMPCECNRVDPPDTSQLIQEMPETRH